LQFTSVVFTKAEVLLTKFRCVIIAPLGFPKEKAHQDTTVKFLDLKLPSSGKTNLIAFQSVPSSVLMPFFVYQAKKGRELANTPSRITGNS